MIPYPYNMVDMGGIDLAEANGTVVEGLYAKIVEAVNACGDVVLYNWKFAGIEIAPQHASILLGDPITINGAVQVTEQDLVTVPGINPDPPPPPVLVPLTVTENGQFSPQDYDADGFSEVSVNVSSVEPIIYTNIESGEYKPYALAVDSSRQVAVIGSNRYIKNNNTEVYGAVCQSTLGYKAILLACPVADHVQDDTKFSPGGTGTGTRTVGGVNYYYSWTTGISGNYTEGPAVWSDVTAGGWDQLLNLLFNEILKSYNLPSPAYKPEGTGFIPVPEGYDGFGPLFII